jgi:broad specificity phosphatase PhoE
MMRIKKYWFLLIIAFIRLNGLGQTTIILLRHAEKDTTLQGSTMMTANPPLSKAGKERAARLVSILEKYKVDEIYSTDYTRTKETIAPFANKINKPIQLYDPKTISAFTEQLRNENKTIVVIGHSNTTPALVNLLVKENKFKTLDDNEYGTYWIVKIKDGKAEAEEMKY